MGQIEQEASSLNIQMIRAVKANDFPTATTVFEKAFKSGLHSNRLMTTMMNIYLSAFDSKTHLPELAKVMDILHKVAMKYVTDMLQRTWEPRLRWFQPLFEAYENALDIEKQLELVTLVKRCGLTLRSEQFQHILRAYAKLRHHDREKAIALYPSMVALLRESAEFIQGIPGEQLTIINNVVNRCSSEMTAELGLLVSSKDDLTGSIISDRDFTKDGSLVAYNISFKNVDKKSLWANESIPLPRHMDPYIPEALRDCERIEFFPERFVVKAMRKQILTAIKESASSSAAASSASAHQSNTLADATTSSSSSSSSSSTEAVSAVATMSDPSPSLSPSEDPLATTTTNQEISNPDIVYERSQVINPFRWEWESTLDARLVSIPPSTAICPHCEGTVDNIPLQSAEKQELREALYNLAGKASPQGRSHLQAFETFLQSQKEFEYIIDGANVAYDNQNYGGGRFSYGQIRLVLEELERIGKRVLVILPSLYSPKHFPLIHNSIRTSRVGRTLLQPNEMAFVRKLEEQKMLYTVPSGMNDDLFWLLATVYEGRRNECFVVTNDLVRDHALSAMASKTFARLRTSMVVYFSIFRASTRDGLLGMKSNAASLADSEAAGHTVEPGTSFATSHTASLSSLEDSAAESTPFFDTSVDDEDYVSSESTEVHDTDTRTSPAAAAVHAERLSSTATAAEEDSAATGGDQASANPPSSSASSSSFSSSPSVDAPAPTTYRTIAGGIISSIFPTPMFSIVTNKEFTRYNVPSSKSPTAGADTNAPLSSSSSSWAAGTLDGAMNAPPLVGIREQRPHSAKSSANARYGNTDVDDFSQPGVVTFFKPGNYSRNIQEAPDKDRWHIPATDQAKWICLRLRP
eukprot:gene9282-6646_t